MNIEKSFENIITIFICLVAIISFFLVGTMGIVLGQDLYAKLVVLGITFGILGGLTLLVRLCMYISDNGGIFL